MAEYIKPKGMTLLEFMHRVTAFNPDLEFLKPVPKKPWRPHKRGERYRNYCHRLFCLVRFDGPRGNGNCRAIF